MGVENRVSFHNHLFTGALGDQESVSHLQILAIMTAALGFAGAFIRLINDSIQRREVVNQYSSSSNIKILQLRRRASGTKLWNIVKVIAIVSSVMLLSFAGLLIYTVMEIGLPLKFDLSSVLLLAVVIGLPIYLLISVIVDERRARRGAGSRVAERAELELSSDYQSVVEQCQRALSVMGAHMTHLDAEQGAIEAELKGSKVTIQITKIQDMHYHMSVVSDDTLPSVRFDFGKNKKIVDDLIKRL